MRRRRIGGVRLETHSPDWASAAGRAAATRHPKTRLAAPLHQQVRLAFFVSPAVSALDFAKAACAIEADGRGVTLEHPEPQRRGRFHRERKQRLTQAPTLVLRTDV